jgi:hypothetical protein
MFVQKSALHMFPRSQSPNGVALLSRPTSFSSFEETQKQSVPSQDATYMQRHDALQKMQLHIEAIYGPKTDSSVFDHVNSAKQLKRHIESNMSNASSDEKQYIKNYFRMHGMWQFE